VAIKLYLNLPLLKSVRVQVCNGYGERIGGIVGFGYTRQRK
jgi:hypothetical protein